MALKAYYYPLTSKLDTPAQLAKHEHCRQVLREFGERRRQDAIPALTSSRRWSSHLRREPAKYVP
jgi:hypothetical protein